ncbi:enoyl-CoA hydratase OS=Streptomyces glaucescens OX=1907 GN=SGLAU_28205 PE=3 SV=1 [Streptomyces glaucescens]
MEPQLSHRVADSVATVVIRNPAKRNAMTARMWRALPPLLDALAGDPAVRALVLTGEGGTFCAGADISTLRESAPEAQGLAVRAEEALAAFPKPTLGGRARALRGRRGATGGRLRPAVRRGVGAVRGDPGEAGGVPGVLDPAAGRAADGAGHRQVPAVLRELIDAARVLRTGLVDEVLPEGELGARVAEFTRSRLPARS